MFDRAINKILWSLFVFGLICVAPLHRYIWFTYIVVGLGVIVFVTFKQNNRIRARKRPDDETGLSFKERYMSGKK